MSLQEADYGATDMAMTNQSRFNGDETLLVKFYSHPRMDQTKSAEAGRPIYKDTDYIQIMTPGNKDSIVIRPVTEIDRNRFPEHYRKYKAREDQEAIEGTLLSEWPAVTRGQVAELQYLNIRTVEQLANVSDANSQNVMGIQILRQKAQNYLETSERQAAADTIAALQARLDALENSTVAADVPRETSPENPEAGPEQEQEPAKGSGNRRKRKE